MKLPVNRSSVLSYLQLQLVLNWDNLLWSSWRPGVLGANLLIPREEILNLLNFLKLLRPAKGANKT